MHEVSVMTSIIENVRNALQGHNVIKVEEVDLTVGELTFLGLDQLQFAYEILTRGTELEGSTLVIETERTEVSCSNCGYSGPASYYEEEGYHGSIPQLACPKCKSNVTVLKGKSCRITSVKVEE
ncbi:MAG: putative hydrogenase nickel incorporation protein HypA [Methanomassiliicoccales archaeon PtaU1.Bin124]|nr:MAG: putative hydrogenase nickel incorporation protein HypA [Methanomassiliicoccales archaeon PtaU1.Bin124]